MWRCSCRGAEALGLLLLSAAALAAPSAPAPATPTTTTTLLLALRLNGVEQAGVVPVLQGPDGLALPQDSWAELGLRGGPVQELQGRRWQRLDPQQLRWRIEGETQTLVIDAPAAAFVGAARRTADAAETTVLAAGRGAFFNYDLQWQRGRHGLPDTGGGLVEGHAFGPAGTLRSSALLREGGGAPRSVRLDSTFTHDRPARLDSLRVGDSTGHAGAWGRPLRFGGLHWGTDFSLQPGFTHFPLPSLRGEATLPSTVELTIDQSRRVQGTMPAGAFELHELPVVNGMGEVRLVVRDLLGREQVVTMPYHTSAALLRPGLAAHSLELGAERLAWGSASGHYGRPLGAATWREGVSERFTREWRAEFIGHQFTAGASGTWLLPGLGTLQASTAASNRPGQPGAMAELQAQRQARDWSAGLNLRLSSHGFRQMGQGGDAPPRLQAGASFGGHWAGWGVGASVLQQHDREGRRQDLWSLNLARHLGAVGTLALSALHDRRSGRTVAAFSFSHALDSRQTVGLARSGPLQAPRGHQDSLAWQLAPPEGAGVGAQLLRERFSDDTRAVQTRDTAQLQWRLDAVALQGALSQAATGTDGRLGASGGFGWLGDTPFASRRIDGSFALVQVGGLEGVQVLHEHRPVARTDAQGRAWVPGLRGNESNRISVEAGDLPLDVEVGALELRVQPPARSGVVVELPLRRTRSAQFTVLAADGTPPPPGSRLVLQRPGDERSFVLGFEGRAFLSGLAAHNEVVVRWPGHECRLALAVPAQAAAADLGPQRCR